MQQVFADAMTFGQAFNRGLENISAYDGLGTFILALANANYDQRINAALEGVLAQRYDALYRQHARLCTQSVSQLANEDENVFSQIVAQGFSQLPPTEFHQLADWELQYNHLRSFRPQRMSNEKHDSLYKAFNPDGFHFNKPFLQMERFCEAEFASRLLSFYYNKFPFTPYHLLMVPEREQQHAQYLTEELHQLAWKWLNTQSENLSGLVMGYNSRGAFASVNHLHFQISVREQAFPVCSPDWQHNGGTRTYPACCQRFDDVQSAWQFIAHHHQANRPYNLLYVPGSLYGFSRAFQGTYPVPEWGSGFSWHELAGGMIVFQRQAFDALCPDDVHSALRAGNPV